MKILFVVFFLFSCVKKEFSHFAIASQGVLSSEAAVKMFQKGGNVFDAFASVSFALGVERPQSSGLGGGGFLTYYRKGMKRPSTLDFRERAPIKSTPAMFQDKKGRLIPRKSLDGVFSVAVPGMVAGVLHIHKKFGVLPLETVMEPAIKLAEEGFAIYKELADAIFSRRNVLVQYPSSKRIFFKDGRPRREGDWLYQKDLAHTLRTIAKKGKKGFYQGRVAGSIIGEIEKGEGILSYEDLSQYKVINRPAVHGRYKGFDIYSMGLPSSGGIHIIQLLNILEKDGLIPRDSFETIHLLASAMRMIFMDRARHLGDGDFVDVPVKKLISKKYARSLRKGTLKNHKLKNHKERESKETVHFSIMDKEGNTISSTQSINGLFGSGVVATGVGIVLNNEMDDFTSKVGTKNLFGAVGGEKNIITPGKRPLSSMSPTIVFKDGKPLLSLGSPNGTRIITCVAQVLLNYLAHQMPLDHAVAASRIHHQWPSNLLELEGEQRKNWDSFKQAGYRPERKKSGCKVQAVERTKRGLFAVSDPRYIGRSAGR